MLIRANPGEYPQYEGKRAVQRCDECMVFRSDIEAAKRAHGAGIYARFKYPCVLLADLEPIPEFSQELWFEHPPVPIGEDSPFSQDPDRGSYCLLDGVRVPLWRPLTEEQRRRISILAIKALVDRDDRLLAALKNVKRKKAKEALLMTWERNFLEILLATWGLWGEGVDKYREWMRDHRKSITKKFGFLV